MVYQHLTPEMDFDSAALERRLAHGAMVVVKPVDDDDVMSIQELLGFYIGALAQTDQFDTAQRIKDLSDGLVLRRRFVKVVPKPQ